MTKDNNLLGKFHLDGIPPAPRGVPQVETVDTDANWILHVSAQDRSTGKSNQITITNEKGRLSQSEIDRMVDRDEDEAKSKIEAKNGLENSSLCVTPTLKKNKEKFESGDKEEAAVQGALDWWTRIIWQKKDEVDAKQKELEGVVNPIMMKAYLTAGGGGDMPGGTPVGGFGGAPGAGGGGGPTVD